MTDLGSLDVQSVAEAINEQGQIVGRSFTTCCESFRATLWQPRAAALAVTVDVRPGEGTAPINPRSKGVIPVAILSDAEFDAMEVDPARVCFGDAEDPSQRDCTEAHGRRHLEDMNDDGRTDLLLHFETQQTGIDAGDTEACLTGEMFGGDALAGCDAIRAR
jgi:hypothetical protein